MLKRVVGNHSVFASVSILLRNKLSYILFVDTTLWLTRLTPWPIRQLV